MLTKKIPLVLVTGFLGSGKTSFLENYLTMFAQKQKIAIVQNEFAPSDIDSEVLREKHLPFVLRELNNGSIFCTCLFSSFKDTLIDISNKEDIDVVLIEATGIADPIAVAQVMEDSRIDQVYYLQEIITIIDGCRFLNALEHIMGVRHQVEVADYVFINKADLVDEEKLKQVRERIREINPLAKQIVSQYGSFKFTDLIRMNAGRQSVPTGELTRCGQGNYVSRIFKTTRPVEKDKIQRWLESLDEDILRLKGFITDREGQSFIVQYLPGQIEIRPCPAKVAKTELISIGFSDPHMEALE